MQWETSSRKGTLAKQSSKLQRDSSTKAVCIGWYGSTFSRPGGRAVRPQTTLQYTLDPWRGTVHKLTETTLCTVHSQTLAWYNKSLLTRAPSFVNSYHPKP